MNFAFSKKRHANDTQLKRSFELTSPSTPPPSTFGAPTRLKEKPRISFHADTGYPQICKNSNRILFWKAPPPERYIIAVVVMNGQLQTRKMYSRLLGDWRLLFVSLSHFCPRGYTFVFILFVNLGGPLLPAERSLPTWKRVQYTGSYLYSSLLHTLATLTWGSFYRANRVTNPFIRDFLYPGSI